MRPQAILLFAVYVASIGIYAAPVPEARPVAVDDLAQFDGGELDAQEFDLRELDAGEFDAEESDPDVEDFVDSRALKAKRVAKPVAKPVTKAAPKPVAKPVAKPAVKPVAKPAAKPVANPAAKPAGSKTLAAAPCKRSGTCPPPPPPPPPPIAGGSTKPAPAKPAAKPPAIAVGSTITVGGKSIKLTSAFAAAPGANKVFGGTEGTTQVIAKENPGAAEITNTEAASTALGSGLFISSGEFGGANWLILKKFTGQDFGTIGRAAGGFDEATCTANIAKAINLAAAAQAKLAAGAKFIQGDTNQENYLFDTGFTTVDMIDFGVTSKAFGDVLAGQKKALAADTFTLENMKALGACK